MGSSRRAGFLVAWLVGLVVRTGLAFPGEDTQGGGFLLNPGFEEDDDQDGVPDHWDLEKDARVTLTDRASLGRKAAQATAGYGVLQQNLHVDDLAGRTLRIKLDAASPDGAALGVYVGYLVTTADGGPQWQNSGVLWDERLGKSDDLLTYNYAYPILAAGAGVTGVAHWAYNVDHGSSWDDTNGGMLDYSFIYDGTEKHPLNRRVNPTGEVVVPSIRWEALRAGIQEARLLLALREASQKGDCAARTQKKVEALWSEVEAMYRDPSRLTTEWVADLSPQVRLLHAQARRGRSQAWNAEGREGERKRGCPWRRIAVEAEVVRVGCAIG